jgi:hypothetical protein
MLLFGKIYILLKVLLLEATSRHMRQIFKLWYLSRNSTFKRSMGS